MFNSFPKLDTSLNKDHLDFLKIFTKSCRKSIIEMVTIANSGHPGGSLSCIDYLAILYCFIISQTGEKIAISNGHISPAVYSTLAELGYIPKKEVVETFRKIGSIYEGHITRHVPGVWYGTGPLGIGVSVSTAFAMGEKMAASTANTSANSAAKVFALAGDGECQEGQVYEMMNFAKHHNLDNLILFIDYNKVQLTASLKEINDLDLPKIFAAAGWNVIEVEGHDYQKLWSALSKAYATKNRPTVLIGHTIMGQGIDFMEEAGKIHLADWHGKAPAPQQIQKHLQELTLNKEEENTLAAFRKLIKWHPQKADYPKLLSPIKIATGKPITYPVTESIDCRTAYGKALLDLAKLNKNIIALTADLKGSVMTKFVSEQLPNQYVECGICEQHMISAAGGFSLTGFIPFASTFGAFMTSRAKDQARVNDINYTNVKMVATHCGLSVGEDGPTHQAIDDSSSMLGLLNTMPIEPADPNQTDHIIRYIASHYGNFYIRMGRHKFPIITKENGSPFYDQRYKYEYGKCDVIRKGSAQGGITIAATGAMIAEAIKARETIAKKSPAKAKKIEIIAVSSIKKFDQNLINSIKKTKRVITVEDHNPLSGLGAQLAAYLTKNGIQTKSYKTIGVTHYQLSGKAEQLYRAAKIDSEAITKVCLKIL